MREEFRILNFELRILPIRLANREAVATQSPGLLQPWVSRATVSNPVRVPTFPISVVIAVARGPAFIVGLHVRGGRNRVAIDRFVGFAYPGLKQPWVLGRNRFAVRNIQAFGSRNIEAFGSRQTLRI